jgi:hypothetical protein
VIPTLYKFKELTDIDLLLPSSFSTEGFVEYLVERLKGHPEGIIVKDEVTYIFKATSGKQYAVDLIEFLSQLYDGTVQKRYTRKYKLEEVPRCYVVFIGATTPYLYSVIEPDVFVQGLGNRILYDFWNGEVTTYTGSELFYGQEEDMEREAKIEAFTKNLAELSQMKPYFFKPEPDKAADMLAKFKAEMDLKAKAIFDKDKYDLRASYFARMGEMAIKLSALHAVSRLWKTLPKSNLETVMIMPEDAEWAIGKVERHVKNFEAFLNEWKSQPTVVKPVSYRWDKEAFVNAVKNSPDGIMTQTELLEALGWYKCDKFYRIRDTVIDEGKIRRLEEDEIESLPEDVKKRHGLGDWRGEPPVVFALPGFKVEARSNSDLRKLME